MAARGFLKGTAVVGGVLGAVGTGFIFGILLYILSYGSTQRQRQENEILYRESQKPIKGTVLEESYENNLSSVPEKRIDGLLSQSYSNETVRLDSKYTLKIETNDRTLGISVIDGGNITKESLDVLIEKGSKISFPAGNIYGIDDGPPMRPIVYQEETWIKQESQTGTKRADRIKVLD